MNFRIGEACNGGRRVADLEMIDHRRGDTGVRGRGLLLDDGGQPVLRHELLAHRLVGGANADADQRPVVVAAKIEEVVEIDRLMRAVEVADADVHDAGRERARIIRGDCGGLAQFLERTTAQLNRHNGPPHAAANERPSLSKR